MILNGSLYCTNRIFFVVKILSFISHGFGFVQIIRLNRLSKEIALVGMPTLPLPFGFEIFSWGRIFHSRIPKAWVPTKIIGTVPGRDGGDI